MKFIRKSFLIVFCLFVSVQLFSQDNETGINDTADTAVTADSSVNDPAKQGDTAVEKTAVPVKKDEPAKKEQPAKNTAVKENNKPAAEGQPLNAVLLDVNDADILDSRIPGYQKKQKNQILIEKTEEKAEVTIPAEDEKKTSESSRAKRNLGPLALVTLIVILILVLYIMKNRKKRRRVFSTRR